MTTVGTIPIASDDRPAPERTAPCGPCNGTGKIRFAQSCVLELVDPITYKKVARRKRRKGSPEPETVTVERLEFQRAKLRHLFKLDGLGSQTAAGTLMELLSRQPAYVIDKLDPQDLPLVGLAIGVVSTGSADDLVEYVEDPDELDELLEELDIDWAEVECVHCDGTGRPLPDLDGIRIRLQVPISNQGDELDELRFWRPDFGTLRQASSGGRGELGIVFHLVRDVCRLTDRAVGELDPIDLPAIAEVVAGFFQKRRKTGR